MKKGNSKRLIHYDVDSDVLAVYVKRGAEENFVEVAPNIVVELDKKGSVIGIEILNASRVLKPAFKQMQKQELVYAR